VESYDALVAALVEIADDILQERVAPSEGAASLAAFRSSLDGLTEALLVFTSLDSDWDEHRGFDPQQDSRPERRAEIERDIIVEADRFRRRFGK
jgi:hypothetical protein